MDWIFDFDRDGLVAWCADRGMPRHAADQLLDWVYRKGVTDPASMTNLSKASRELLSHEMGFLQGAVAADQVATDGTRKLLIDWGAAGIAPPSPGGSSSAEPAIGAVAAPVALPQAATGALPRAIARGRATECVMIPTADRHTACISSQIGCPVGCRFCASGIGGLEGNLTTGRILEQVFLLSRLEGVGRISHVVFMGMGEPLANLTAVTGAIRVLNAEWGFGVSARRITVSTVGLPGAIRKFCDFDLPVTLALSLHAPNDELRRSIIPWADYSTIDELLDACDEWFRRTGREITLEYILLGGVNDRPEHAQQLASHARRLRANVNLIRYNEVRGLPYARPSTDDVLSFQSALRERGVNAHIRASRGRDIAAACGQLRHERLAG